MLFHVLSDVLGYSRGDVFEADENDVTEAYVAGGFLEALEAPESDGGTKGTRKPSQARRGRSSGS